MAKILYLEDEAWQVQSTVITFVEKELGHAVTLVKSIAEASEALSAKRYDAVFLDIMLNLKEVIEFENSGLQVAQLILDGTFADAGNPATLPIIIASGVWDATVKDSRDNRWTVEDRARALGISHRHFLRKPFLADEVREILEQSLHKNDSGEK
jgi:CheY-like chemotaxis protein